MQNTGTLITSPMSNLADEHRMKIEEGIPLFEMHKTRSGRMDTPDLGYINVRVSDGMNMHTQRAHRSIKWFAGNSAYLTYRHVGKGLLVAFCPDDINDRHQYHHWLNRIKLAGAIHSGAFRIVRYHTIDGTISGKRITEEILYLSKIIHDEKAIVKDTGEVFRSRSRKDVEGFVAKKRADGIEVQGPIFSKVDKIEKLIKRYRHAWIYSDEFQSEQLPNIKKLISERFKPENIAPKGLGDSIKEFFSGLTPAQRMEYIQGEKVDTSEGPDLPGSPEGKTIDDLSYQEMQRMAPAYKINCKGMEKEELRNKLKIATSGSTTTIEDVVGPVTEEETAARTAALRGSKPEAEEL